MDVIGGDGKWTGAEKLFTPELYDIQALKEKKRTYRWIYPLLYIPYNCDPAHWSPPFKILIWIGCDGYPIPAHTWEQGSHNMAQACPGAEWAYPDWSCHMEFMYTDEPGMLVDKRSWTDRFWCCLPEGWFW